ncbi:MAG TPA: hypothetical protein EYN06_00780 [Myxococcales bacterium]|nr:hypothetical protein [Myxococcales bacterium]HIN84983.1 hypothetical protein [Myxococcales bacterium]
MSPTDDVTVSPAEMDALMNSIQEGSETHTREPQDGALRDIVRYDLVGARSSVGRGQLPTLDIVNEKLADLLSDMLVRLTGEQARASAKATEAVKFVESMGTMPTPACLQLVELVGLRGTGVLSLDPALLFHIIDLLLGGKPGSSKIDASEILARRGMTAVERRLFARVSARIGEELTRAWDGVATFGIRPLRVETDPKHIAIFEASEMVVDMQFEVEVAGVQGQIHLIVPQAALRPVEKKLASGLLDTGTDEAPSWRKPLTKVMRNVTLQCTAELGRTYITVRELISLKEGDVIRLDRDPENPITLYLEGSPKLTGHPTLQHGNIAVEVVSVVRQKMTEPQQAQHAQQAHQAPEPDLVDDEENDNE